MGGAEPLQAVPYVLQRMVIPAEKLAEERRAPNAMPSADDRTRRMRDVELFLGPAFCEQSTKAQQYNKGHALQL